MPIRMLRDWTASDKMNEVSVHTERFFTRLIMKVDDHGCFYADARLLKASLFPLILDGIREADILRWTAECEKAGLIVVYEHDSKKYLQIQDFRQRLDKARSKFPLPIVNDFQRVEGSRNGFPAETETETETEEYTKPAGAGESEQNADREKFALIEKSKKGLISFITANNPKFIEPYRDLWNLFAEERSLPTVSKINDTRKRKFSVRIKEPAFNFIEILTKAASSEFLLTGKWFGFDWIIENDSNYLKVIEGNYESKTGTNHGTDQQQTKKNVR
jgi:hypothetical protein